MSRINKKFAPKSDWMKNISVGRDGTIVVDIPYVSCDPPKRCFRDYIRYDIMVDCKMLPELPTDGNPRGVNPQSSSFKDVSKTLRQTDTLLQDNHNGGDIFANHVTDDPVNKVLRVTFSSTEMGAVNGATSMGAILCAQYMGELKDGHVITFRVRDYNTDKMTETQRLACVDQAANLNNTVQQKDESLCYQLGYFDNMIEVLTSEFRKLFVFKLDSEEEQLAKCYNSNFLLRFMEGMHIKSYPNSQSAPTCINNGVGGLVKSFYAQKKDGLEVYEYLLPLLNDFIALYGHILYFWDVDLHKSTNSRDKVVYETISRKTAKGEISKSKFNTPFSYLIPEKYKREGRISADSFVWAVYTAFRANIAYNEDTNEIGWRVDPYILWNKCNLAMWREVSDSFVDECKCATTAYVGCKFSWRRLYNIVEDAIADIQAEFEERCA